MLYTVSGKSLQLCPTLCNPMDCSPPGSSVHGILQARILEWVAMPSSRGSFPPRYGTHFSCIAGEFFSTSATWEDPHHLIQIKKKEKKGFFFCGENLYNILSQQLSNIPHSNANYCYLLYTTYLEYIYNSKLVPLVAFIQFSHSLRLMVSYKTKHIFTIRMIQQSCSLVLIQIN